jgi:predicted dehydrogenase
VAVEHAAVIEANPHLYMAAVSSRRRESAEQLTARFAPKAAVHDSYEALLDDPSVDIVSVCMPNYLHAREAILALEAGKHLILEKPPAITWEELHDLRSAEEKAPGKSVVSFVMRWHPMIANLRAIIDRGGLGSIYYAEADYWHGIKPSFSSYEWIRKKEFAGGAMITGGCHAADIVRFLTGKEAEEVSAYRCEAREDFDYDTTLVAAVKYTDGTVGKLSVSLDGLSFPYQLNIDLLGSEGALRDNRIYSSGLFPAQEDWVTVPSSTPNSGAVSHHPFKQEIDGLVECILSGTEVLSDVEDATRSIAVSIAVEESAATGKPVQLPRW